VSKGLFMEGIECKFCGHEVNDSDIVCHACRYPYGSFENKVAKFHRVANDIYIEWCVLNWPKVQGVINHFERLSEITRKLVATRKKLGGDLPEEFIEREFQVLYDEYSLPSEVLGKIESRNNKKWYQFWK